MTPGHPPPRDPSPADVRSGLDPAHVDALAAQIHDLLCRPPGIRPSRTAVDERHVELDLGRSRFILLGLREQGYTLTRTPDTS